MVSPNHPTWPGVVTLVLGLLLLAGCIGGVGNIFLTDPTAGGYGLLVCVGGIFGLLVAALLINDGYRRLSGHDLRAWEAVGEFIWEVGGYFFGMIGRGIGHALARICDSLFPG